MFLRTFSISVFALLSALLGVQPALAVTPPIRSGCAHGAKIYEVYMANRAQAFSCTRSRMSQAALYKRFGPRQAAPPGHSRHEAGCACDFTTRSLRGGNGGGRWLSNSSGHVGNHLSDTGH